MTKSSQVVHRHKSTNAENPVADLGVMLNGRHEASEESRMRRIESSSAAPLISMDGWMMCATFGYAVAAMVIDENIY